MRNRSPGWLASLCLCAGVPAQNVEWTQRLTEYADSGYDDGLFDLHHRNGSTILAGSSGTIPGVPGAGYYLRRIDAGSPRWTTRRETVPLELEAHPQGVYVVGDSFDSEVRVEVVSWDGTSLWTRTFDADVGTVDLKAVADDQGLFVLYTTASNTRLRLARLDPKGNLLWVQDLSRQGRISDAVGYGGELYLVEVPTDGTLSATIRRFAADGRSTAPDVVLATRQRNPKLQIDASGYYLAGLQEIDAGLDAFTQDGAVRWVRNTSHRTAGIQLHQGLLYQFGFSRSNTLGYLRSYDLADGAKRSTHLFDDEPVYRAVLTGNLVVSDRRPRTTVANRDVLIRATGLDETPLWSHRIDSGAASPRLSPRHLHASADQFHFLELLGGSSFRLGAITGSGEELEPTGFSLPPRSLSWSLGWYPRRLDSNAGGTYGVFFESYLLDPPPTLASRYAQVIVAPGLGLRQNRPVTGQERITACVSGEGYYIRLRHPNGTVVAKVQSDGTQEWITLYPFGIGELISHSDGFSVFAPGPTPEGQTLYAFDLLGKERWNRVLAVPPTSRIVGNDQLLALGTTITGDPFLGHAPVGSSDFALVVLDRQGNILGSRVLGTEMRESGFELAVSGSSVFVGGTTEGSFAENTRRASREWFVAQLDPRAEVLWLRQGGQRRYSNLLGLVANETGALAYVSSGFYVQGDPNPPSEQLIKFGIDQPPTADLSLRQLDGIGSFARFVLDGTGSSDPDDEPEDLAFRWEVDGVLVCEGPADTCASTEAFLPIDPAQTEREIALTVTDPSGLRDTARTTVTVHPAQLSRFSMDKGVVRFGDDSVLLALSGSVDAPFGADPRRFQPQVETTLALAGVPLVDGAPIAFESRPRRGWWGWRSGALWRHHSETNDRSLRWWIDWSGARFRYAEKDQPIRIESRVLSGDETVLAIHPVRGRSGAPFTLTVVGSATAGFDSRGKLISSNVPAETQGRTTLLTLPAPLLENSRIVVDRGTQTTVISVADHLRLGSGSFHLLARVPRDAFPDGTLSKPRHLEFACRVAAQGYPGEDAVFAEQLLVSGSTWRIDRSVPLALDQDAVLLPAAPAAAEAQVKFGGIGKDR